jgi:hypothetical protein
MAKRPSLFSTRRPIGRDDSEQAVGNASATGDAAVAVGGGRPPSRAGKRVLDPLAWKQLRQLALDSETTTQALGEEAVNLLFAKHGLNRSA